MTGGPWGQGRNSGTFVRIGGGAPLDLISYSIVEDSSPIDVADSSGGVQQATFTIRTPDGWKTFRGKSAVIQDATEGTTQLIVTDISNNRGVLTVTANSMLAKTAVTRTMQPYTGTLGGAITYYLSQVGIASSSISIDASLMNIPVTFEGWYGEVYLFVTKMLAPAYGFEVALVGSLIVCRPLRTREAITSRDIQNTQTVTQGNVAQSVQTNYYPSTFQANALAYPIGGWDPTVTIYQVDAGATVVESNVPIGGSLTSIQQPVCVLSVPQSGSTSSVYAVAGNDGLPIPPAEWAAFGGSLTVAINPDTKSLSITIVGMTYSANGPFKIAMSSGPSNYYSSLRLFGTGVFATQESVTGYTTLSTDVATQVLGTTTDSPFITDLGAAYDRNIWTLSHYSGLSQGITVQARGINRVSDESSYIGATLQDFNAANSGMTIAQFDAIWATGGSGTSSSYDTATYDSATYDAAATTAQSIDQFNRYWQRQASSSNGLQAFGNLGGTRVLNDNSYFRIRSATDVQGLINYTAEADTTLADFDAVWLGTKIQDFDQAWVGYTIADFDVQPLNTAPNGALLQTSTTLMTSTTRTTGKA